MFMNYIPELKKLMKNYPSPVKICFINLKRDNQYKPMTLSKFLELVSKCIEDKEGSGSDYSQIKKEIGLFKGDMLEVPEENNKLNEDQEEEIKKISHKKPNNKPPTR